MNCHRCGKEICFNEPDGCTDCLTREALEELERAVRVEAMQTPPSVRVTDVLRKLFRVSRGRMGLLCDSVETPKCHCCGVPLGTLRLCRECASGGCRAQGQACRVPPAFRIEPD